MKFIFLLIFTSLLYGQYDGFSRYNNYIPSDEFNPVSESTLWSFQGKLGKTTAGDTVTSWIEQVGSNDAVVVDNAPDDDDTYLTFGGADYLRVAANPTDFDLGSGDFTLSGKAMATNTGASNYISAKYVNSSNYWMLYTNADDLRLAAETLNIVRLNVFSADVGNEISDNTPFTFTIVCDRDGSAQFYIDGSPVTTTTSTMSAVALDFNTTVQLGAQLTDGFAYLTGRIYWFQADTGLKDADWSLNFYNYLEANGY